MPSQPATTRATTVSLWAAGVFAMLFLFFTIRWLTHESVAVRVAQVSFGDVIKTSSANGKVEPIDDFQAHAQASGTVEKIYVHVGDKVNPGQLLLKMDDADAQARLASAQSTLQAARLTQGDIGRGGTQDERNTYAADLSRAQMQRQSDAAALAALQQLQQKGAASPAEIAAAQDRLRLDEQNLHSIQQHSTQRYGDADRAGAQARLADAQAGLAAAQRGYSNADIHAPFAGTVYSIPISQYDYVPAGDDLIYVADLNRIRVNAYFDEPEVGNLAAGQPVKIVWEAKPNAVWHGHITIPPTTIITYGTRNVGECIINVDDARGDLIPNTNVTVTVTTAQHLHVLSVPREALHTDGPQTYVFRVVHKRLVRTSVQVGLFNLVWEEITSGLNPGDTVALSASTNVDLTDGLDVKPIP